MAMRAVHLRDVPHTMVVRVCMTAERSHGRRFGPSNSEQVEGVFGERPANNSRNHHRAGSHAPGGDLPHHYRLEEGAGRVV
jgi:hypothetical protein